MYKEYGWTQQRTESTDYIFPQVLRVIEGHKQKNKEINILDVGCGNGEIANLLMDEGFNVFGIDASSEGVKIANIKNPNHFFVSVLGEGGGGPA